MTTTLLPAHTAVSAKTQGLGFGLAAVNLSAAYLAFARAGVKAGRTPVDFVFLRFVTEGAIILLWVLRHGIGDLGGVGWGRCAAHTLFASPLFIAFGVGGYALAPLAHGAVIHPAALTLGTITASWLVFRERPPRERALGVAIIFGGLVLIASGKGGAALPGAWRGEQSRPLSRPSPCDGPCSGRGGQGRISHFGRVHRDPDGHGRPRAGYGGDGNRSEGLTCPGAQPAAQDELAVPRQTPLSPIQKGNFAGTFSLNRAGFAGGSNS